MTEMVVGSMGKEGTPGTKENAESPTAQRISLRRMGQPEEQANVMGFLLSDESSYMHGALLVTDGGFHDIR
jgi:NAD(P)-dependent dehydrogenase (short-subunit alcohol dehydrogenase family)